MTQSQAERRIVFFGVVLMALSIFNGFGVVLRHDPMLLSAHLIGVVISTMTISVGACVRLLALGAKGRKWLVWTLLSSSYANWLAALVGALLGTNRFTPIHGRGGAGEGAELLVGVALVLMVSDTFAMLAILAKGALSSESSVTAALEGQRAAVRTPATVKPDPQHPAQ